MLDFYVFAYGGSIKQNAALCYHSKARQHFLFHQKILTDRNQIIFLLLRLLANISKDTTIYVKHMTVYSVRCL